MTDVRGLQRALFRLQMDPALAQAVLDGDDDARATLGLAPDSLAILTDADLPGVTADPGGKRRTQVLSNASSEFTLTLAAAAGRRASFLQDFATSAAFGAAVARDEPLPFAFADYASAFAREADARLLSGLVELERTMAHARRAHRARASAKVVGDLRLPDGAALVALPAGTFAVAEAMRAALDAGRTPGDLPAPGAGTETVLVVPRVESSPHRLAEVHAERLQAPADALLHRIASARPEAPFEADARALFAREHGAEPGDLEAFVADLVAEGLLVREGA